MKLCNKQGFPTKKEALSRLNWLKNGNQKMCMQKRPLRVYYCKYCKMYHLTSKKQFMRNYKEIKKDFKSQIPESLKS